ncbi:DUF4136 domain-containing protein [Ottowia thiooxydans]|uniref:DUF4136 domain-containing protein n=1 Tax=Ottowia thiooxydans TaxID=219182 RepID=UPI0004047B63|nr:DUF4136 domain-containing protein [Ottowia thiooxydans]
MRSFVIVLLATVFLSACAVGPRSVDASVHTTAARAPGSAVLAGAHYKFERGQQAVGQPAPERLEAMAKEAMARVGLVHDEAQPRLGVQVSGNVGAYWTDGGGFYGRPGWTFGFGMGTGFRGGSLGFGLGAPLWDPAVTAYVSEVGLLMRDLQSGQIVYDTRARHDGLWHDTDNVLAALFTAALEGYPEPGQATRRVVVPLLPVTPAPK